MLQDVITRGLIENFYGYISLERRQVTTQDMIEKYCISKSTSQGQWGGGERGRKSTPVFNYLNISYFTDSIFIIPSIVKVFNIIF